ncbi:ABC transporter permease [Oceanobacter sp. 4_MG-2023]|uniref:ABC transporter permease n=1 Tax=Oceanobacter sp. 4_MG-2023 TaxID=3062623 RepID=UPI002734D438|nr:ABC transporter permease [Oceanobacter sp. 4_MG-2023]MDP2546252.1 ABC transporter permease [Oceanobacter sp. 4_MG-2023]
MLAVQPVVLLSDLLIFALVAVLILFFVQLARDPLARGRWRSVFVSRIGSAAFLVILFYVLMALLDSLHYREPLPAIATSGSVAEPASETMTEPVVHYSQEVKSVLDAVLAGLHGQDETTYSEPFSIYSFARENQTSDDGNVVRAFPRLAHAGSHLQEGDSVAADVWQRSLKSVLTGVAIMAALVILHWQWRLRCTAQGCGLKSDDMGAVLPWKTIYITLGVLVVGACWVLELGQYYHILGTDKVGQDVLYQGLKAIRTGVLIGTLATLLTLPLAILLGISAGYFRGWVDDLVQYVYTTLSSIPGILLIAASVLLIDVYIETHPEQFQLTTERADFKFLALCFILGMTSWTGLCRLLRAETLKVSQLDYVQAARAFGVRHGRIIGRHILPNVTHLILIALVLDFSGFVLAEAVLSYIGVGVDPSMASWGNMINEARAELSREPVVWWSVAAAFVLMFILVLAANLFADKVRDAFDPRSAG